MVAAIPTPAPARPENKKPATPPKPAAGKPKTDLQKVLEMVQGGRKQISRAARFVTAWGVQLATDKAKEDVQAPIKKVGGLLSATEERALKEAVQTLEALVDARWKPPQVQVSANGGIDFVEGAPVTFRKFHLDWGLKNGVFTEEEAKTLVIARVTKGAAGSVWVTAKSEKTGNHFGPYQGSSKFTSR